MRRQINSPTGELILNTLESANCPNCILKNHNNGYAHIECPMDSNKKRIAYHKNNNGILYICCDKAKTTKLFKDELNSIIYSLKSLVKLSEEVKQYAIDETKTRVNRVIHNLKSINAHAIQELYTLVPQDKLVRNVKENPKIVESIIQKNIRQAALTYFRMAKFNLSIKVEFSIYEKLLQGDLKLDKRNHNIRDVIMIVLYTFFKDFNERNVYINIEEYYEKVYVDFESIQVAIYHIIENASKYVSPNTDAYIKFNIERGVQYITFEMTSLYIHPDEEKDIFNEGYSGVLAQNLKLAGKGIGMYRAKRLIELNEGTLTVEAGDQISGSNYANNKFIITLPTATN